MTRPNPSKFALRLAAVLLVLLFIFSFSPALAAPPRDRKAPTRPTNLHVTGTTAYSVALVWNPSTDNSGVFSYKVVVSYGQTWTVPQTQTSFNWNFGLIPGNTYSFYVYAVDGSGNRSQNSNTVTTTIPQDITPPTPPVATLIGVNPTEVSLEWTASTDDGPYLFYQIYVNGVPNVDTWTRQYGVVHDLTPSTTYNITVRARDLYGNNVSQPSNTLTITTSAVDPNDTEPPSPPTNLSGSAFDCAEVWLSWVESFDNQTPQAVIHYEVYVNGVLDHTIAGDDRTILYGTVNGDNTFTLIAVDSAGNHAAPTSITLPLTPC